MKSKRTMPTHPKDDFVNLPVNSAFLETLVGYNARRAALRVIEVFSKGMLAYDLRPVDFSVLSLIHHNPGITSRQLCRALAILPPNLVGKIRALEIRGLIRRQPHPLDGRAVGLHMTDTGAAVMHDAEALVTDLDEQATHRLSPMEKKTLMQLLQKIHH